MEYKVKFEVFEGPLDLLLYLIKKEEVDIYEVNLTKLATQFIEYLQLMKMLDIDIAGEFIVMAATLMYIKSKELLPKDQQVKADQEEDDDDPRWELIKQLIEYKKFKDAAARLQRLEIEQENIYPRLGIRAEIEAAPLKRQEASIFDLLTALNNIIKRLNATVAIGEIEEEKFTVSDKIEYILKVIGETESVKFSTLFQSTASRAEIIATFLALLELIRLKQVVACQTEDFGEIEIYRAVVVESVQTPQTDSNSFQSSNGSQSESENPQSQQTESNQSSTNPG